MYLATACATYKPINKPIKFGRNSLSYNRKPPFTRSVSRSLISTEPSCGYTVRPELSREDKLTEQGFSRRQP